MFNQVVFFVYILYFYIMTIKIQILNQSVVIKIN